MHVAKTIKHRMSIFGLLASMLIMPDSSIDRREHDLQSERAKLHGQCSLEGIRLFRLARGVTVRTDALVIFLHKERGRWFGQKGEQK